LLAPQLVLIDGRSARTHVTITLGKYQRSFIYR